MRYLSRARQDKLLIKEVFPIGDFKREFLHSLFRFRRMDLGKLSGTSLSLSFRELMVLEWIKEQGEGQSLIIRELAEDMDVSRPLMSQILHALKSKGYVSICSNPEDRRRIMVVVTHEGADALMEAYRCLDNAVDRLFTRSHMQTGEIVMLIHLINRLSAGYRQLKT